MFPEPGVCLCGPSLLPLLYLPLPKAWALAGRIRLSRLCYVCCQHPQPSWEYTSIYAEHVALNSGTEKGTCALSLSPASGITWCPTPPHTSTLPTIAPSCIPDSVHIWHSVGRAHSCSCMEPVGLIGSFPPSAPT